MTNDSLRKNVPSKTQSKHVIAHHLTLVLSSNMFLELVDCALTSMRHIFCQFLRQCFHLPTMRNSTSKCMQCCFTILTMWTQYTPWLSSCSLHAYIYNKLKIQFSFDHGGHLSSWHRMWILYFGRQFRPSKFVSQWIFCFFRLLLFIVSLVLLKYTGFWSSSLQCWPYNRFIYLFKLLKKVVSQRWWRILDQWACQVRALLEAHSHSARASSWFFWL